jgi:hypothetical protein
MTTVVSRRSGHSVRIAGLERAARLAGEAFGHEDMPSLPRVSASILQVVAAAFTALVIVIGLTALVLR